MPFVKLDCGLLDSSLWFDRDARDIFLTALLMARPTRFKSSQQEIKPDAIAITGYEVPAGDYGFVAAAGPAIAARAVMPWDKALLSLIKLAAPDPESRSTAFDGRRMIRVEGGYIILNYDRYRNKDYTATERSRRLRARAEHDATPLHTVAQRHATQAEAEAEAYAEAKAEALNALSDYPSDNPHPAAAGLPADLTRAEWLAHLQAIREDANKAKAKNKAAKAKALQDAWNELADPRLPRWKEMPVARQQAALARLSERGLDTLRELIQRMNKIRFLVGENDRGWRASPDWFLKPGSIAAIVEGKHDRPETPAEKNRRMEKEMEEANHRAGIEFRAKVEAARKAREEKRAAESAIRPEP